MISSEGYDLLERLLCYDPKRRITAEEALNHKYFREHPLPQEKKSMPSFLPTHSLGEMTAAAPAIQQKRPREDDVLLPSSKKQKV